MLVPDRRRQLLEHVRRHGSAQVGMLAEALHVSEWTVRRDLTELERQGQLRRAHGGAYVPDVPDERGRPARDDAGTSADDGPDMAEAKTRIAAAAAERISDDTTIMLLSGSTTAHLVPLLHGRRLTVVTNGLEIAYALRDAPDITLVVVGGYLHRHQMTLMGPLTEHGMRDLHMQLIVAGAHGVHPDIGVTGAKVTQAGYHHGMLKHTDGLMVLADSSKLGRRGPTVLAELGQVDTLVTDAAADPGLVAEIGAAGPQVVVAR
ncbi:DeoR/GlpR family DNA-binding transcription regulator [Jatrophihabitans fulvus]